MYEKLNKNGKLILYVPALQFLYSSMDKKTGHFRRYDKKNLEIKLKSSNFKIEKIQYCDCLGVLITLLYIFKDKIKTSNGDITPSQIKFYDTFIVPISFFLDKLLFKKIAGKNILVIATKI